MRPLRFMPAFFERGLDVVKSNPFLIDPEIRTCGAIETTCPSPVCRLGPQCSFNKVQQYFSLFLSLKCLAKQGPQLQQLLTGFPRFSVCPFWLSFLQRREIPSLQITAADASQFAAASRKFVSRLRPKKCRQNRDRKREAKTAGDPEDLKLIPGNCRCSVPDLTEPKR